MAEHRLWGRKSGDAEPVNWKSFFAGLVQHRGLRPAEIAEMTLPELLLYSDPKTADVSLKSALAKGKVMKGLNVEHYLALAKIRTGAA